MRVRGWKSSSVQIKHCNSRSRLSRPELAAVLAAAIASSVDEARSDGGDQEDARRLRAQRPIHFTRDIDRVIKNRAEGCLSTCLGVRCDVGLVVHWARRQLPCQSQGEYEVWRY